MQRSETNFKTNLSQILKMILQKKKKKQHKKTLKT